MSVYDSAISKIENTKFIINPYSIICVLTVGHSDFIGVAHLLSNKAINVHEGKSAAKSKAVSELISAEAYRLKQKDIEDSNNVFDVSKLPAYKWALGRGVHIKTLNKISWGEDKTRLLFEIYGHNNSDITTVGIIVDDPNGPEVNNGLRDAIGNLLKIEEATNLNDYLSIISASEAGQLALTHGIDYKVSTIGENLDGGAILSLQFSTSKLTSGSHIINLNPKASPKALVAEFTEAFESFRKLVVERETTISKIDSKLDELPVSIYAKTYGISLKVTNVESTKVIGGDTPTISESSVAITIDGPYSRSVVVYINPEDNTSFNNAVRKHVGDYITEHNLIMIE